MGTLVLGIMVATLLTVFTVDTKQKRRNFINETRAK